MTSRTVLIEEGAVQGAFDASLADRAPAHVGLCIGKLEVGARDFVLALVPFPDWNDDVADDARTAPAAAKRKTLSASGDTSPLNVDDDWIVEHAGPGDIVISDDILLAERVLASGARAMSTRGRAFTPETIGEAVAIRELMAGLRETGETTGGPPPFSKRDRSNFLQRLDETVNAIKRTRDKQGPG